MYPEIINFQVKGDSRGNLISLEAQRNIPFDIKRVYYLFNINTELVRGKHAHKTLQQVLICMNGSCSILLDNGKEKEIVNLSSPDRGLVIGNLIWREMFNFSSDCVIMVLADQYYDEEDYIRDYNRFLTEISN